MFRCADERQYEDRKILKEVIHMTDKEYMESLAKENMKESVDSFAVGDTVRVLSKVKEGNRERTQAFEGVVIKRQNGGVHETFTVRKNSNGCGVEKTWPLHSPILESITVIRRGKVRRARLTYLRERTGKAAKVKEVLR
jgi:large subunit ribosomal protein L19